MNDASVKCVAFNVQRAARAVTQRYDEALAPAGITSAQFTLLNHIDALRMTVSEVAERVGLEPSTATRNLRLLAEMGLIALERGDDRRQRVARLLPSGRTVLRTARPLWRAVQARTVRRLGADRFDRLLADLAHV